MPQVPPAWDDPTEPNSPIRVQMLARLAEVCTRIEEAQRELATTRHSATAQRMGIFLGQLVAQRISLEEALGTSA